MVIFGSLCPSTFWTSYSGRPAWTIQLAAVSLSVWKPPPMIPARRRLRGRLRDPVPCTDREVRLPLRVGEDVLPTNGLLLEDGLHGRAHRDFAPLGLRFRDVNDARPAEAGLPHADRLPRDAHALRNVALAKPLEDSEGSQEAGFEPRGRSGLRVLSHAVMIPHG